MRKVLLIVTDTHNGHPVALPANGDGWETADGNFIETNDGQKQIWGHWCVSADYVGDLRKGAQLIIIHAGDPIEGVHHGIVSLLTDRKDEQERMHVGAMEELFKRTKFNPKRDRLIYLDGTEAHGGPGNSSVERIARMLLKSEDLDGTVILPRFYKRVNGVLFDIAHKGFRLSTRRWTRTNSLRTHLMNHYFDCLEDRQPMPRYVIRAHFHTFGYDILLDKQRQTVSEAFLMPAWKLKDDYVYHGAAEAVSSIGALAFDIDEHGNSRDHPLLMRCEQDVIEDL